MTRKISRSPEVWRFQQRLVYNSSESSFFLSLCFWVFSFELGSQAGSPSLCKMAAEAPGFLS